MHIAFGTVPSRLCSLVHPTPTSFSTPCVSPLSLSLFYQIPHIMCVYMCPTIPLTLPIPSRSQCKLILSCIKRCDAPLSPPRRPILTVLPFSPTYNFAHHSNAVYIFPLSPRFHISNDIYAVLIE